MSFFSKSLNFFKRRFHQDTWDVAETVEAFKRIDIANHIEKLKKKYFEHTVDHYKMLEEIFLKITTIEIDELYLERYNFGRKKFNSAQMKKISIEKKKVLWDEYVMNSETLAKEIFHRIELEFKETKESYKNRYLEMESILYEKENLISFFELHYPESHCRDELDLDNYNNFCDKVTSKFIANDELELLENIKEMNKKIEEFQNKFGQ